MIEKVEGIMINGRCFAKKTLLSFFPEKDDRIAIVYGKNGSGKSTISDGFSKIVSNDSSEELSASLIDHSGNEIDLSAESKIFVFNEKYIDKNVKIDADGLGSIILLGGQIDLQADIDKYTRQYETEQKKCGDAEKAFDAFRVNNNPCSPDYHLVRIKKMLQGEWAYKDATIKGNKINSKVTDDIVKEIGDLSVPETKEQLQQKFDEKKALLDKGTDITTRYLAQISLIGFTDGFEQDICALLAKPVEKPVLTERESMILSMIKSGRQPFVEAAKNDFSNNAVTICPYCFQTVDDEYRRSLINSINKVLNKDVDEHKAELQAISFPEFVQDYSKFIDLDAGLVKEIHEQIKNCQIFIEKYKSAIQQKLNSIYSPVNIDPIFLENGIRQLNTLLIKLESKRKDFISAIQQREEIRKELLSINKKIAHLQIAQTYRDYKKQQLDKRTAELNLQNSRKQVENTLNHLKKLKQKKSNVGLAIENINNALDYVFFSKGRLSIELKNDKYYLKSNGKDVKPKNVSLGERNIIALCYFFTQILTNQDIERLYQDEELVVIDDPISSFDFENKVGISSFLRFQTNNILVGNSKSKILFLTHDLLTFFDLQKIADEMGILFGKSCKTVKSKFFELYDKSIRVCAKKRKTYNEYRQLLNMIFRYAMDETTGDTKDLDLIIGNAMRRSLEAFSTFIYGTGISEVSFNPKVIKSLGEYSSYFENLMYRLVLNGESHLQAHICGMHSDLNFYEFISEKEKRRTCKDILCFMYCLNPDHIGSHMPDAVQEIQKWIEEIPSNKKFAIMVNSNKT